MTRFLVMVVLLSLCAGCAMATASRPNLVPWPRKVTMGIGSLVVPKALTIKPGSSAAGKVAVTFAQDLRDIGFTADAQGGNTSQAQVVDAGVTTEIGKLGPKAGWKSIGSGFTAPGLWDEKNGRWIDPSSANVKWGKGKVGVILAIAPDKSLGAEGYRLKVGKDIRISAPTETGLFWGTRTLLQLLANGPGKPIPQLTIVDKPMLSYRAVMVDVARQFHTIGFHREMVKKLAAYKLNVYHIHFTDDQSYTLPSDAYPDLPTPDRHYTKQELKDLVKLAAKYHVMIVPEVEMPGHNTALCAGLPDVVCQGKKPGGTVCVGSNRSFNALKTLITETMDIFPAPYFHLGADEVGFEAWDGCPDCEKRKISESLKSNESLYTWFINRCNRFVNSKGRRSIAWDCFKTSVRPAVDKNVLVDEWDPGYAMPNDLLKNGYDLINSSCNPLYVCRGWFHSPEQVAAWDVWHFGPMAPPPNEPPKIAPTKKLIGAQFCSWENNESVQDAIMFGIGKSAEGYASPGPRAQILAERAWTGNTTSKEDLLERLGWKDKP